MNFLCFCSRSIPEKLSRQYTLLITRKPSYKKFMERKVQLKSLLTKYKSFIVLIVVRGNSRKWMGVVLFRSLFMLLTLDDNLFILYFIIGQ